MIIHGRFPFSCSYHYSPLHSVMDSLGPHQPSWSKCFKNDVLAAVNLGEDTDTVAAVAGGLAGIIYGLEADQEWVDALVNKEELLDYLW